MHKIWAFKEQNNTVDISIVRNQFILPQQLNCGPSVLPPLWDGALFVVWLMPLNRGGIRMPGWMLMIFLHEQTQQHHHCKTMKLLNVTHYGIMQLIFGCIGINISFCSAFEMLMTNMFFLRLSAGSKWGNSYSYQANKKRDSGRMRVSSRGGHLLRDICTFCTARQLVQNGPK